MQISSNGGSIDTEVKLLAVKPRGCPSIPAVVTMVTPVMKLPKAVRNSRASNGLRRSATNCVTAAASASSLSGNGVDRPRTAMAWLAAALADGDMNRVGQRMPVAGASNAVPAAIASSRFTRCGLTAASSSPSWAPDPRPRTLAEAMPRSSSNRRTCWKSASGAIFGAMIRCVGAKASISAEKSSAVSLMSCSSTSGSPWPASMKLVPPRLLRSPDMSQLAPAHADVMPEEGPGRQAIRAVKPSGPSSHPGRQVMGLFQIALLFLQHLGIDIDDQRREQDEAADEDLEK